MLSPNEHYEFITIENDVSKTNQLSDFNVTTGGSEYSDNTTKYQVGYPLYRIIPQHEMKNAYIPFGLVHFSEKCGTNYYSSAVKNKALNEHIEPINDAKFQELFSIITKPINIHSKSIKRKPKSIRNTMKI